MANTWGWRCSKCGFETTDGNAISGPVVDGICYLTCPTCGAVGEFVDAPPAVDQFDAMARVIANESHWHRCSEWRRYGTCDSGTCVCECGAVLSMGPTFTVDGRWAWKLPDGSFEPFPDVRESEAEEGRTKY